MLFMSVEIVDPVKRHTVVVIALSVPKHTAIFEERMAKMP